MNKEMGHLTLLIGCMFAQKTTELLRRIRKFKSIGYSVLVVNYASDTRYGENQIASHDLDSYEAKSAMTLKEIEADVESGRYNVLVIDEGQFFKDLYEKVTKWSDELKIHIIVAGLDGDSERRPFGDMLKLIPYAEKVERLTAFCASCKDGTSAHFSKYVAGSKGSQVEIGGADRYIPVCRKHFLDE
jgi:thymidine kinase